MKTKYEGIIDPVKALEAVKRNGDALQYVKDQSETVCLEAVKRNGDALRYVLIFEIFEKLADAFGL